ncbi:MAG: hypothetical protein ACT4PX_00665 [Actinomycetota bacterium]
MATPIYLEMGAKKVFACALDWPGWARAARTEEAAMDALADYAGRYAPVAAAAGVRFPASAGRDLEVVERVKGSATTDFGAPGAGASADEDALTKAQAERLASLVEAAWATLDRVAAGAPASLRKGPRGGGRDRDKMVDHVVSAEAGYLRQVGLRFRPPAFDDRGAVAELRSAFLDALRSARAPIPERDRGTPWPWRYAARRVAWHALDHAWEMEDRSG